MIATLLWACAGGGNPQGTGEHATDYLPPEGHYSEYGWAGAPSDAPMMLLVDESSWILRNGETWNTATELGTFAIRTEDGVWIGDTHLLPEQVELGLEEDGITVTDMGHHEVYYGIFDNTVTVEVDEGELAGEHTLAVDHGPIVLTWEGVTWELVYYEN